MRENPFQYKEIISAIFFELEYGPEYMFSNYYCSFISQTTRCRIKNLKDTNNLLNTTQMRIVVMGRSQTTFPTMTVLSFEIHKPEKKSSKQQNLGFLFSEVPLRTLFCSTNETCLQNCSPFEIVNSGDLLTIKLTYECFEKSQG